MKKRINENSKTNQPVNQDLEELRKKTIGLIVFSSVSMVLITVMYLIYNFCCM